MRFIPRIGVVGGSPECDRSRDGQRHELLLPHAPINEPAPLDIRHHGFPFRHDIRKYRKELHQISKELHQISKE
jgi:hypothetical protein